MENALHRFVRLLRLRQVRISIPEALDAMACAREPGMLADKAHLKAALRVALIKDRRDEEVFDEIFDRFFALVKVGPTETGHGHGHGHEDLSDTGALEDFTLSEEPSETPQQGHSHGKPVDIRDYFNPEDLAQQYNLHQEANKIDLAAMTEEIVLSKDNQGMQGEGNRVQIETDHLSYAGSPGQISQQQGTKVDADLSVAEQEALLGWLNDVEDEVGNEGTEDDAAALRRRLTGVLAGLPEAIKRHLEALLALEQRIVESSERAVAEVDRVGEHERMELEESLRRLAHSLHGGLTHKRARRARRAGSTPAAPCAATCASTASRSRRSRSGARRTSRGWWCSPTSRCPCARRPGSPCTSSTACRTCSARCARSRSSRTCGRSPTCSRTTPSSTRWGSSSAGTCSTWMRTPTTAPRSGAFHEDFSSAVTRRTTVLVLGDGRGNGNDPNLPAFEEITRRARETIWLTPEPRYSWGLGACDLPAYAEYCSRVRVVRDLTGLESAATDLATELVGR